jgi:hypothetical protein
MLSLYEHAIAVGVVCVLEPLRLILIFDVAVRKKGHSLAMGASFYCLFKCYPRFHCQKLHARCSLELGRAKNSDSADAYRSLSL